MATLPGVTGLGSGLDVTGLVDQLMSVEQKPLEKLNTKEAAVQLKISALGTFRGAVSAFQTSLAGLEQSSLYTTNKATLVDSDVASASASATADLGTHSLEVTNLAVAQRLKSDPFASLTDTIGTGTLTIQYGAYTVDQLTGTGTFNVNAKRSSQSITIDTAHNTLAGVRDAINAAKLGVSASIVNDGSGNRLVLTSKETGTENSVRISVTDDDGNATDALGLSQLAYDPAAVGGGQKMAEVVPAEDAQFILDGLTINKASNTVTDVLSGTTLTLKKTNSGAPTELTIAQDTTGVKTAIDAFVKAYNELDSTVDKLTGYDAASKTGGTLQGDATVRSMISQIRDGLSSVVSNNVAGGYTALAQVGLALDRNGQLTLNSAKLQTALQTNPVGVRGLFATSGSSADSLVSYVRSANSTPAGTYALNISKMATQGKVVGSDPAALTIDGTNDALTVTVNGTSTSITLAQNTYTADALVAELQTKLNGSSAFTQAGITVSVTQSSGVLSLSSSSYGSASKVVLAGGSAQDVLFGMSPTSTDGVDIEGTLGGVSASGSGRQLTAPNGLAISVAGGATGDRGNVIFTRGIAVMLDNLLGKALGSKGTLSSANEGLQADVEDIKQQREKINAQLEVKKARYTQQFNTLDGLITNMQSTMSYLSQQLSSLNNLK